MPFLLFNEKRHSTEGDNDDDKFNNNLTVYSQKYNEEQMSELCEINT